MDRRNFMQVTGAGIAAAVAGFPAKVMAADSEDPQAGSQRLSIKQLKSWEALGYGMFIHFGMSTFLGQELPDGQAPASTYNPDKLDVDQWVSVARDAGMKYAVLTTKHVAGHCLWPSEHTEYTVANSGNTTDVVEAFVKACEKRHIKPGLYYCSWDNHNRFGSETPSDGGIWSDMNSFPKTQIKTMPPHTTSLYHNFQTAQITELLTRYGSIMEMWIDIPGVLGRGYRTFLYNHIAQLQPDIVIMMNSGIGDGTTYNVPYTWPSDLVAIERKLPPKEAGYSVWRMIEGKNYYMPGEVCDPIGKEWFWVSGDSPRPDEELTSMMQSCRDHGVNLLLDVPPDKHGLIPQEHIQALQRLKQNAAL